MNARRLIPLVLVGALAACAESPVAPTDDVLGSTLDPDGQRVAPAAMAGLPTIHVMGAAHREFGERPIILDVNARRRADGSADGSYYYRQVSNGVWIRVGVTCLSTRADNEAFVAGVIEDSSIPSLIGTVSYFFVFDNGKDGDVVSLVAAAEPEGEDTVFCVDQPELLPQRDVLDGDVIVKVR